MWMARGLPSTLFGAMEYLTKCLGIARIGFNVTSKVVDKEQRKRYDQGTLEFGIPSPIFVATGNGSDNPFSDPLWRVDGSFEGKKL
ncbi:hypothetical protein Acr_25g0007960 [Actinidia rufa]|uniref:Uncharacterized protein n=1 Tax=Actinidia rufa TaxID=165716 RepID=A0A7J0GZX0_9ERIC|nr:hypothetical protein Acr_25g0007960 [Actinidia rufa]